MNKAPTLHFAAEALQPQPDIPWIVEDFISAGSLNVLIGDAGSGKTFVAQDIGVCVALQKKWLGSRNTDQKAVLFIDEESGIIRFNGRLKKSMIAHNADDSLPFFYLCFAGFDLRRPAHMKQLEKYITDTNAGIVFIDALMDVIPGADENSVKDISPVMNGLKAITEKTGAAIVLIHHVNKNGSYRGSSSIKGAVDLMVSVEKKGNRITFKSIKNRDGEPFEFAADAHFETDKFYLSDAGNNTIGNYQKILDKLKQSEKTILEHLAIYGNSSKSELENLPGFASSTLRDAINNLKNNNLVDRSDDGGRGVPAFYNLTNEGFEIAVFSRSISDPWISAGYAYVFI